MLAVKISQQQSKDQILENYLNVIYLGRGAYGIQAASAGVLRQGRQGPLGLRGRHARRHHPVAVALGPGEEPREVPGTLELRPRRHGRAGLAHPVSTAASQRVPGLPPGAARPAGHPGDDSAGHLYTQAKAELETRGHHAQEIDTEGLTVEPTIDSNRQKQAVDAVNRILARQPDNLRAALVSVDPKTGRDPRLLRRRQRPGHRLRAGAAPAGLVVQAVRARRRAAGPASARRAGQHVRRLVPPDVPGQCTVDNSEGFDCGQCAVQTAMTKSINTVFYKMAHRRRPGPGGRRRAPGRHPGRPAARTPRPASRWATRRCTRSTWPRRSRTFAADGRAPRAVPGAQGGRRGRAGPLRARRAESGSQAVDPAGGAQRHRGDARTCADGLASRSAGGRPVAAKTGTVQHPERPGPEQGRLDGRLHAVDLHRGLGRHRQQRPDPERQRAVRLRPDAARLDLAGVHELRAARDADRAVLPVRRRWARPPIDDDLDDESSDEESEDRTDEDDERRRTATATVTRTTDRSSNSDRRQRQLGETAPTGPPTIPSG